METFFKLSMKIKGVYFFPLFIKCKMREKIKTGLSIFIILILLPYVAVVFRTGNMRGQEPEVSENQLEEYVAGILPGQMQVSYQEEALKAQAVIIRTNLLKKAMEFYHADNLKDAAEAIQEMDLKAMGFNYTSPEDLEEMWGYEQWKEYEAKLWEAVGATEGQILTVEELPIELPYHAVSAGRTRNGQILGDENYSYLEPVDCPQDVEAADYMDIQFLELSIVPEIVARDESGYVMELHMEEKNLTGEEFRSQFSLNSSNFTLDETEKGIRVVTKGLGHGLGLSMYQANRFAAEGQTYLEILHYFYKNVECISFS